LLELETAIELVRRLGMLADVAELERRTAEVGKVLNGLRRALVARESTGPRIREARAAYGAVACALRPDA
jgi:hypothetical protein